MDESRKQFAEAFEELTGWELEDYPNQDYADTCWEFWKKSREAIEIIAPKFIDSREALAKGYTVDYSNGFGDAMDAYEAAIRAAGIKVKE